MNTPTKNESLPELPQAFFDEFGRNADDRVWDYGRACYEAALTREAPTEGVDGDVMEMRICETRRLTLRPNRRYVFTIDPNCEACRAWNSYYPEDATPPAPQRHPDALEDGSLSKSTVKRLDTQRLAQGEEFQSDLRAYGVAFSRDGVRIDPSQVFIQQPPHQYQGEVEQRARELLAREYERTGSQPAREYAGQLRSGLTTPAIDPNDEVAIRAVTAALTEAKQQGPGEGKSPSLKRIIPDAHPYPKPDQVTGEDTGSIGEHAYADGWNDCRKAMIAAAAKPSGGGNDGRTDRKAVRHQ